MKIIKINKLEENQSVFKYVKKYLSNSPLSYIEKLFRKKDVKINDHWVNKNYILKENDTLKIYIKDEVLEEFKDKPKNINNLKLKSSIIYEDENILIINKNKGVLVHEDQEEKVHTLSNEVISYLTSKNEYSPLNINGFTPSPCHRLDRNTSGIIVFSKNFESLKIMEELFKDKSNINKFYLALVKGKLPNEGEINKPLVKDSKNNFVKVDFKFGKESLTKFKTLKSNEKYTLVEANLITGRTHQIRVHFASINSPIIGDNKYGDFTLNKEFKNQYNYDTQFLHAYKLKFLKIEGKLSYLSNKTFIAPLANKEQEIIDKIFK